MLEQLSIRSLGVISQAELTFGNGLTVITGETGAGKTMVLTSLQWLSGARVNPSAVRQGEAQASVDAEFSGLTKSMITHLEELGGDLDEDAVWCSRIVPVEGRSRAVLAGRPVPASALGTFSEGLVSIHGQSEQMILRSPALQREFLDSQAGEAHRKIIADFEIKWDRWLELAQRLKDAQSQSERLEQQRSDLAEAITKVSELEIQPGEDEEIRGRLEKLTNLEALRQSTQSVYELLEGNGENGAAGQLGWAVGELEKAANFDSSLRTLATELNAALTSVEEIKATVLAYQEGLNADPEELEHGHRRLAAITDACRGRAKDANELLEWLEQARKQLASLEESLDLEELQAKVDAAHQEALEAGEKLTASRHNAAKKLAKIANEELQHLALAGAALRIEVSAVKPSRNGFDAVTFWLRPHPEAAEAPVATAASGGELSRVMLALELACQSGKRTESTLVFDEIDAGIGGNAAVEVGRRLARLARNRQVLVVTHLAQVAAWGDHHLVVTKDGGTAQVSEVTGQAREIEIARMLSGKSDSNTARQHAAELITACRM